MRFGFYTLGCKVNQYETQAMAQLLTARGHEVVDFQEKCDVYVINTCSVTAVADRKNRTVIRRCRKENPNAVIAVCGCYPQHDADAVAQLGVDVIGGSSDREEFVKLLITAAADRQKRHLVDDALSRRQFQPLPAGGGDGRTRGMLKVQDGCDNFCTYCIIPYTRGHVRSADLHWCVEQAVALSQAGYREIVLTGIEIASWGRDLPERPTLITLLEAVCHAVPQVRIRLGSLEPRIVDEDFCRRAAELPNLCQHFHLSLQSGSDAVLKRMKRKYDTNRFYQSVEYLRRFFPNCGITTDMIVGFPGETEEEFEESLNFIQKCGFSDMHIFPYSRRPGTPADKMPNQLPNAVKEDRSRRAIQVAQTMKEAFLQSLAGTTCQVLFEQTEGEFFTGHTPNYVKVYARGADLQNKIHSVLLENPHTDGIFGNILP